MKKTCLLHSEISYLIAALGHRDAIVIADCGLPTPRGVRRIDIALTKGVPGFIETVETVLSELQMEEVWVADEMKPSAIYQRLTGLIGGTPIHSLPHERFKEMIAGQAVAVIRTGECTPYANVLIKSGVVF